jgi:surfactin synthase thioesterase subunit
MIVHAGELEDGIVADERSLDENLAELEHAATALVDWRAQVRKHPLALLGVAFGGGVLLATLAGSRRAALPSDLGFPGSGVRPPASEAEPAESEDESPDPELGDGDSSAAHEIWEDLKGALLGATTAKATEFLAELLPGLHEEFELQRRKRGKPRRASRASSSSSSSVREDRRSRSEK